MRDRAGQQLGNYRLIRLLGQGGFAEVYLAEHVHLSVQAAIKVLHTQLISSDTDGFHAEARTIARLVHPHIVRVLEFGVEDRTPFLVMDYAPYGTLRQRHPRGTRLPFPTIVSYVSQIAGALQYAHDQKLIHRDVKPENILVGRLEKVLLSDFGIASLAQSSHDQSIQEIAGTMAYMAPEQIQGKPRPASDQYALGIVTYEWISGELPFRGSLVEIASQHLSTSPPSLLEKDSAIPSEFEQVVLKALAKDPHKRFASVLDFASVLEQAYQSLSGRPSTSLVLHSPADEPLLPTDVSTIATLEQSSTSPADLNSPGQSPQPIVGSTLPISTRPVDAEKRSTTSSSEQVEETALMWQSRYSSVQTVPHRSVPLMKKVLLAGTALFLIIASLGLYSLIRANQLAAERANYAAQTSVAQANYSATGTSQAIASATSLANANATSLAELTATAIAQAQAAAMVIAANPYPSYLPGHGTLALYDPLTQPYQWSEMSDPSFGGACQFIQGAYHISESKNFSVNECSAKPIFGNLAIEVTLTIIKGDCGGVAFRYSFTVCANGSYSLDTGSPGGQLASGPTSTINVGLGRAIIITLYAGRGSSDLYLYVNGHYLAHAQYSSSSNQWAISLLADDLNNPTEVVYSNVKVWTF